MLRLLHPPVTRDPTFNIVSNRAMYCIEIQDKHRILGYTEATKIAQSWPEKRFQVVELHVLS